MSAIVSGAVIAAGEGSRLKQLGVPKPLIEVAGVPLIEHVLGNFEAAGIVSAAVIFNESERDCEAFVRERFGRLVRDDPRQDDALLARELPRHPRGRAEGAPARLDGRRLLSRARTSSASSSAPGRCPPAPPSSP